MGTPELQARWRLEREMTISRKQALQQELARVDIEIARYDWALAELKEELPRSDEDEHPDDEETGEQVEASSSLTQPASAPRPREAGPSAMLEKVMAAQPGVVVDARAGLAMIESQGWTTTSEDPLNLVRSSLAALARKGVLAKESPGRYVYRRASDTAMMTEQAEVKRSAPSDQFDLEGNLT